MNKKIYNPKGKKHFHGQQKISSKLTLQLKFKKCQMFKSFEIQKAQAKLRKITLDLLRQIDKDHNINIGMLE